jgi:DNA-binding transcriptional MerR regulator
VSVAHTVRPHGRFLAAEVGELAGVSGTTIGQWARRGYIRASRDTGDPHVYSVEDVAEAAMVRTLLDRGVRHAEVRRVIAALSGDHGDWPLSAVALATTTEDGRPHVVLRSGDGVFALSSRGWQRMVSQPPLRDVPGWRLG